MILALLAAIAAALLFAIGLGANADTSGAPGSPLRVSHPLTAG
jgi:hypothetical protein